METTPNTKRGMAAHFATLIATAVEAMKTVAGIPKGIPASAYARALAIQNSRSRGITWRRPGMRKGTSYGGPAVRRMLRLQAREGLG